MKTIITILLLTVNSLLSFVTYYSDDNRLLNNIETQLEDVSLSEIYTHTSNQQSPTQKVLTIISGSTVKIHPTTASIEKLKHCNLFTCFCKYGRRVLYSSFLN